MMNIMIYEDNGECIGNLLQLPSMFVVGLRPTLSVI